jgi:short-subunit dehydrogenase
MSLWPHSIHSCPLQPNPQLLDYSATKGAIVSFTRGLSLQLADKGKRRGG